MPMEMDALHARIAALERENKELRERNQKLASSQELSPQLPDNSSSREGGRKTSTVYFDGYRTRIDDITNGGKQTERLISIDEANGTNRLTNVSSMSFKDFEIESNNSEDLDSYLERQFGDDDSLSAEGNEMADDGKRNKELINALAKEKRVSFGQLEKRVSDLTHNSEDAEVSEPNGENGAATSEGDKHGFRRSSMLNNQRWSNLTLSSNGDKVHVHFPLGQKKKNRYSVKVEEFLKVAESSLPKKENPFDQVDNQRTLLSRSRSESVVTADSEFSGNLLQSHRHSCPDKVTTVLGRMNKMAKKLSMRTIQTGDLQIATQKRLSFQQFMLLSVDPLIGQNQGGLDWGYGGDTFLDPIVLKTPHCIDKYPRTLSDDSFSSDELSAFCCGDGVKVRVVPKVATAGARRLGWMGPKADQYKLLVFTDGNGAATYGVAITASLQISEDQPGYQKLHRDLHEQQDKRNAARKISIWWRYLKSKWGSEVSLKSTHGDHKKGRTNNSRNSNGRSRRRTLEERVSSYSLKSSVTSATGRIKKKIESKKKIMKKKLNRRASDISDTFSDTANDECVEVVYEKKPSTLSERSKALGKESFNTMKLAAKTGNVLIAEKSYVLLVGEEDSEQYLLLRSLQHIVDFEREETNVSKPNTQKKPSRHQYLAMIQKSMSLTPSQARVQLPKSDLDILTHSPPTFDIDLPAPGGSDRLSIPLPLPRVADSWGLATLVHHLQVSDLLRIINLLLIERSVLVIGQKSESVTACTCALLTLLRPFKWASNFMPLLPFEMLDFVGSPVPFIIGMVARNSRHSEDILGDRRVVEAMKEGLSVINLETGLVHLTAEAGLKAMVDKCPAPRSKLSHYKNRLKVLMNDPDGSLGSFSTFLTRGLSPREIVTTKALCKLIRDHVTTYAGDVVSQWHRYGSYKDGGFTYYPALFTEPLRKQSEARIQMQEMMSHSQLFLEFVDQQQKASTIEECGQQKFIAAWIYVHRQRKKRREKI